MGLQVDYISDLHIGLLLKGNVQKNEKKIEDFVNGLRERTEGSVGDILCIAGDISEYNLNIILVLEEFAKYYRKVFFVYGNHDLYLISGKQKGKYHRHSEERKEELKALVRESRFHNISILDNRVVEYEGVTIAGSSLWYTLPRTIDKIYWKLESNDSGAILPCRESDNEVRHQRDLRFYRGLQAREEKVDILLTHIPPVHLPNDKHRPSAMYHNVVIAQEVEEGKELPAKNWVCGHLHVRTELEVNGTMLYNNASGYIGELALPTIRSFELN